MCMKAPGCTVWTLDLSKSPGTCWLRTLNTTQVAKGLCTTGRIGQAPPQEPPAPSGLKNVLFFAIDDLRPELSIYGSTKVYSPHMDALAKESMVFERMYTAVAVCGPARTAILTGRRPDTTRNWRLGDASEYWRNTIPNASSLPQYFKERGYVTIGQGKVFHPGALSGDDDKAYSWSPEGLPYYAGKQKASKSDIIGNHPLGWAMYNVSDDSLMQDGDIADNAIKHLKGFKDQGGEKPFFLAVGFHRPHMPEQCPVRYYDMYPLEKVDLPLNPAPPVGVPSVAVQTSQQHRHWLDLDTQTGPCVENFTAWSNATICRYPDEVAKQMRRAYRACTSFVDAQVGRVIQTLKGLGLFDNTVIVLWGDHGWHLGELNMWAKYSNFEAATRIPFVMHLAGQVQGQRTSALVEANDIFPTVAEAAGLPVPPLCDSPGSTAKDCVEGISAVPLWDKPLSWKTAAFSQYPRPYSGFPTPQSDLPQPFPADGPEAVMGYAIRVNEFRYVEWVGFNHKTATPDWSHVYGRELYSHEASPVPDSTFNYENENLATDSKYEDIVKDLSSRLKKGWRYELPQIQSSLDSVVI